MPRPDASAAFIAAAESPYVHPAIFVQINAVTGPLYIWSGVGSQLFNNNIYTGVGQFGMISTIEEGTDIQARGIALTLSGIDPTILNDTLNEIQQGLPALVYLGLFSGFSLDAICCFSGRVDQPTITVSGETANITINCENRFVEMNTSVERRYTSSDQHIDYPADEGFQFVTQIQNITIYWGRHPGNQNNFTVQGHG